MEWSGKWHQDKKIQPEPDAVRLLSDARAENLLMAEKLKAAEVARDCAEKALVKSAEQLYAIRRSLRREQERNADLEKQLDDPKRRVMTTTGIMDAMRGIEAATDADLVALIRRAQLMRPEERQALRRLIDTAKRRIARLVCGI